MNKLELEIDVENGLSSYEMSKKYNKGSTTIRYWLKKYNLKTNPNYNNGFKYKNLDWIKCQELNDNGKSWRELKKYGYTSGSLSWAIKNKKIKLKPGCEVLKLAHKEGRIDYSPWRTEKFRKNQSQFGGLKENSGRCKHISYTKKDGTVVKIQGSWEEKLVKFLDDNNINWNRNRVGYKYLFENKEHLYFPDFYLMDYEIYVEVKGYETDRDREKWKQFPFKLHIVKKQEIQDLTSWWKTIKLW
jgi:hypothetical protein